MATKVSSSSSSSSSVPSKIKVKPGTSTFIKLKEESIGEALTRIVLSIGFFVFDMRNLCILTRLNRNFRTLTIPPKHKLITLSLSSVNSNPLWQFPIWAAIANQAHWEARIPQLIISRKGDGDGPYLLSLDEGVKQENRGLFLPSIHIDFLRKKHSIIIVHDFRTINKRKISRGVAIIVFVRDFSRFAKRDDKGHELTVAPRGPPDEGYVFTANTVQVLCIRKKMPVRGYNFYVIDKLSEEQASVYAIRLLMDIIQLRPTGKMLSSERITQVEVVPTPSLSERLCFCCSQQPPLPQSTIALELPQCAIKLPALPTDTSKMRLDEKKSE